jgi:hypothetical protein
MQDTTSAPCAQTASQLEALHQFNQGIREMVDTEETRSPEIRAMDERWCRSPATLNQEIQAPTRYVGKKPKLHAVAAARGCFYSCATALLPMEAWCLTRLQEPDQKERMTSFGVSRLVC